MKQRRTILILLSLLSLLFVLPSCSSAEVDENPFYVYYRDTSSNNLYPVTAKINENADPSVLLRAVYDQLSQGGDGADYISPIPVSVTLNSMELDDYNLRLNYTASYTALSTRDELLLRAAVVKTMTQLPFISTVEFFVENQPYTLPDGTVLGPQRSRNYVDLIGNGLNAYSKATINLFFSTDDGQKLHEVTQDVTYNSQNSIEQVILVRLIAGPQNESQGFATLSPDTRVLSVSTLNNVCSVDFNGAFLDARPGVAPEIAVYSVVNSLTEISTITTVQITVNGERNILFQDHVDLSSPLTRNLDYLEEVLEATESAE